MYVGHYAPALLAKAAVPESRLWKLFVAAQALDIGFDLLVLAGVERLSVRSEARGPLAIDLEWMPYSHSLLAAGLAGAACAAIGRSREAVAIGLVVASHWVLDLLVHVPDLHLGLGPEPRLGLGLWRFPVAALVFELAVLLVAAGVLYRRLERGRRVFARVIAAMVVVQPIVAFGPAPESVPLLVGLALLSSVLFAVAAARVDR